VATAAPLLFGMLIDKFAAGVLVFSSALSIAAFIGLCSLGIGENSAPTTYLMCGPLPFIVADIEPFTSGLQKTSWYQSS
jgi:hypothetical protein